DSQERSGRTMIRQLEERITYYQGINDSNLTGYLVFDRFHFHIIDANTVSSIILGIARDALIGTDIRELFHDIRWPENELPFHQSELQYSTESGSVITILASMAQLESHKHQLAVLSFTDISNRVKIEQALKESRTRYHNLFHSIPIGLYQSTKEGLLVEANSRLADILGFPDVSTLLTTPTFKLFEDERDREELIGLLESADGMVVKETKLRRYSGSSIWARITTHAVLETQSDTRYFEGAIEDITEEKNREIEEEIIDKLASRSLRMDTVGKLAGGLAHEFNNILAAMKLRINVCRINDKAGSNTSDLDYFDGAIDRANSYVEGLLAAAGDPPEDPIIADINTIVMSVLDTLPHIEGKSIEQTTFLSSEPLCVRVSAEQITFVLTELLQNAAQAVHSKGKSTGKITILTARKTPGRVMSGVIPFYNEPHASITVQDNGCGMPPEIVDRVFEPFFTTQEFGQNRGLGLTRVYGIIRQHKGGITIHSKPGIGTTAMVFLPLISGNERPVYAAAPPQDDDIS
ncbi:MAG: PAS domain S-box protein, partial [Spirochaetaceae bacterium]|nr:PAS domain S-box protein [Spirochaetaceae bacterium]